MASVTGQAIREELVRWDIIRLLGTATATSGGADRIRDTVRLSSAALPSTMYEDCWVRATSSDRDGEISKVNYLDPDNGDLYVSPSFTGTFTSTSTYEIYRPGILPDDVDRARDEALTSICSQWAVQPLTELANGDMEDAVSSANWVGTSSTLAMQNNIGPPQEVWRNVLRVTNSGANGRAASASLYGRVGQSFYVYVPVSVRSGTATLIVRDVTNGANITLSGTTTSTGRGWTGIEVTGQVPTSGAEIAVWLTGDEATAVVDWGPVHFHWQGQRRIALPTRIESPEHIGRVYYLLDYAAQGSNDRWGLEDRVDVPSVTRESVLDGVVLQFPSDHAIRNLPYFYQERVFYDALNAAYMTAAQRVTGDAATTLCPIDYAAAATVKVLAGWYMSKHQGDEEFWMSKLGEASSALNKMEERYGPPQMPVRTRERTISIPYLKV